MFAQPRPSPRHGEERCEKERGGVAGDKIVFVKCFQDTTQAPGAIMRDDGFSLTLSNIPCDIFPRLREHEQKQMGTTIITLLKGVFTWFLCIYMVFTWFHGTYPLHGS